MFKSTIKFGIRAVLSVLSFVLIFIFSEFILRDQQVKPHWISYLSPYLSFKDIDVCGPYDSDTILVPRNSLCNKSDNFELRSTEQSIVSPKPIVVFMGDSFVFGHGVSSSSAYPAQIQKLMNERLIPGKVINAGIPGSGTDIQIAYFEKYILTRMKPDIVVWNVQPFDLGSLGENNLFCLYSVQNSQLIKHKGWLNTLVLKNFVSSYMPNAILKTNTYWFLMNHITDRWTLGCSRNIHDDPSYHEKKFALLLERIIQLSQEHHFSLVFALIDGQLGYLPVQQQKQQYNWYPTLINTALNSLNHSGIPTIHIADEVTKQLSDPQYADSSVSSQMHSLGVSMQNLADTLFLKKDGEFNFGERHMNEIGNQMVAEVVFRFLFTMVQ